MHFILAFGIAFLLPVLLMLLERAGIVTRDQLKRGRRYAILVAFVIAAVATPPDVLSQFMLAIPLICLYELSLVDIWLHERRRAREQGTESLGRTQGGRRSWAAINRVWVGRTRRVRC